MMKSAAEYDRAVETEKMPKRKRKRERWRDGEMQSSELARGV